KFAVDVAARRGHRESERPRQVMEQRLFFDGINVRGAHPRVHQRVVDSSAILPHATIAPFPVPYRAFARTQLALDLLVVGKFLVELCFDRELRIVLLLRTSPRRDSGRELGKLADAESRSRRQSALQERPPIEFTRHVAPSITESSAAVPAVVRRASPPATPKSSCGHGTTPRQPRFSWDRSCPADAGHRQRSRCSAVLSYRLPASSIL